MARRLFASLAHGLGVVASCGLLSLALCGSPLASETATSVPAPVPQASSSPDGALDPGFLLLPAFDLQWVSSPKTAVKVGDVLVAQLQAPDPKSAPPLSSGLTVKLPPGNPDEDDLGFDVSDHLKESNGSFQIRITALKPGEIRVPSLGLADASGKFIARTNPIRFEALSAIAKNDPHPKQPNPPKPPVSLSLPVIALGAMALVLLALIAALIYWIVRWSQNRRAKLAKISEPPKPEDEVALAALAQIERKQLLRSGQFKAHYFAISEAVKRYLGARFDFDAAESTTYELIAHLEGSKGLAQPVMDSLREMFDKLDRVKFTDYVPVAVEGTELLEEARKLVMMTRRPPSIASVGDKGQANATR